MTVSKEISEYLEYIVECIKNTMSVTAIYLFGSYATGKYNENSDLDIYIVTSDKSKRQLDYMDDVRIAIGWPKKMPMDIIVNYDDEFEKRSKYICSLEQEVIDNGVILYANK